MTDENDNIKSRTDQVINDYYKAHPEEASQVGGSLLSDMKKENQQKAALYDIAAGRSLTNPLQNEYRGRFLWLTNIGWTQWLIVTGLLYLGAYILNLPHIVWLAISLAVSACIIWKRVQ